MTILYPIRYQDSVDLEGDNDDIITLLNPPEQRMLQSILNNVESNPLLFIQDYAEQDTDVVDAFLAALMVKLMGEPVLSGGTTPRTKLTPDSAEFISGTLAWTSVPTEFNAGAYTLTGGINSQAEWSYVPLIRGTYLFRIMGRRANTMGIARLSVNSVPQTTIDMYNSTTLANQLRSSATFTITDDQSGATIALVMSSKNASSSNYNLHFNWVEIIRTGD